MAEHASSEALVHEHLVHLDPAEYHEITPEDFNAPGLRSFESVGPDREVRASGPVLMIHDGRFDARRGIGHHPHQGMERLFYILEGAVDHDDALNSITGHMGTGDLGILTEGRRGMIHQEWNPTDGPARAFILVYPNEPLAPSAAFDAVRDDDAPRVTEAEGVITKQVAKRGDGRLHGEVYEFADSILDAGAQLTFPVDADEGALLFVVEGQVEVGVGDDSATGDVDHTFLVPPAAAPREVGVTALTRARVLRAVHGSGDGLQLR